MNIRWFTVATAVLVGAGACSGCSQSRTVVDGTTTVSSGTSAATNAPRVAAGKVTTVHDQRVTIDGVVAGNGTTVLSAGSVASDANGSFDLSVGTTVHRCLTSHDSILQIRPDPTVLISWTQGSSWCEKSGGKPVQFGIGPDLVASMKDPVFRVTVDQSGTVLKVDQGFVSVKGRGSSVNVGPHQQVRIPAGGPAGAVEEMVGDAEDNANFGPLEKLTPRPDVGRPKSGISKGLDQVLRSGFHTVMVAAPDGFNEQSAAFFRTYIEAVALHWDVKIASSSIVSPEVTIPEPTPDVVLRAAPAGGNGSTVVPLFTDGTDTWQMVARDAGLAGALRSILIAELNTGDYSDLYTQVFGHQPDYEPVADLVLSP